MTREERNQESYALWGSKDYIGTFVATPRYGKTRYGIDIIGNIVRKFKPNTPNILVVVRSIAVKQQWVYEQELYEETNGVTLEFKMMSVVEACNATHTPYYLVIFDEVHRFLTPDGLKLLSQRVFAFRFGLGLTGTPPFDKDDLKTLNKYLPIFDTISREQAVTNGWILPKIEVNVVLELSPGDKLEYERLSQHISNMLTKYRKLHKHLGIPFITDDFTLIRSLYTGIHVPTDFQDLTNGVAYIQSTHLVEALANIMGWSHMVDSKDAINMNWNPNVIHEESKLFMDFTRMRNDIIINNNTKADAVVVIAQLFPESTICFNESIEFAEKLVDDIMEHTDRRPVVYHGSIKSRPMIDPATGKYYTYKSGAKKGEPKYFGKKGILKDTLEGLNEGRYDFLSAVKALDEGVNVPNLSCVICTSGTMNPISYIQRSERASTLSTQIKRPVVFNLVFNDFYVSDSDGSAKLIKSRDLTKLKARQRATQLNPTWIYGINDLNVIKNYYYVE